MSKKAGSDFIKNVLTLMTGTTIAQAIPIAMSPILTRIYTPSDFGLFALYMSIATIIAEVATGRYELAIMLPKKDEYANQIFLLSISISFILGFLTFLVIFFFNENIVSFLGNQDIKNWLYFVPLTVTLTGIYQSFNYWHNRHDEYKQIGKYRVVNALTNASINIGYKAFKEGAGGLILGPIIGRVAGILYLLKLKNTIKPNFNFNKLRIIALAKKYKKFPLINSFHAFVDMLKENLTNIYLSLKYATSVLGHFYFVLKIMQLPSIVLGLAMSQVFYKKASVEYANSKDIRALTKKLIVNLALIAFIPAIIVYLFSEDLFVFVFGSNWAEAGRYAKAMTVYIFFDFIASPVAMIPLITNRQGTAFYWAFFQSALHISVFVIGYYLFGNLYDTLLLLSVVFAIFFPIYFVWIYKIAKSE